MEEKIKKVLSYADGPEREEKLAIIKRLAEMEKRLSKAEILAYAKKIKPLMRGCENCVKLSVETQNDSLFWIPPSQVRTESFSYANTKTISKAEGLKEIARIKTYHRYCGYSMFLRPSTDEAIWQCPKEIIDKVCAFEFVVKGENITDFYDKVLDLHVLETVYYAGWLPDQIASQEVIW